MPQNELPVIMRYFTDTRQGEVIAFLPTITRMDPDLCVTMDITDQTREMYYPWAVSKSRPASPQEYDQLYKKLVERFGESVTVKQRMPRLNVQTDY